MDDFKQELLAFLGQFEAAAGETDITLSKIWSDRIVESYTENHRHYHTLRHLEAMWLNLGAVKSETGWTTPDGELILKLAIIFHDIVYDPRAKDNETKSNELFLEFAQDANLTSSITHAATQAILATIKHQLPDEPYHPCLPFFLDLDLEVLSRPRSRYKAYAQEIRQEYIHIPDPEFRAGRTAVLRALGAGDIYFTDACKALWTEKAKENISWEISVLESSLV